MNKSSKDQAGFGIIEALFVIVIIVLVAGAGWVVYKHNHKTKIAGKTTSASSNLADKQSTTNLYHGWESVALASPNLGVKYPSSWAVKTSSDNIEINSSAYNNHYFSISLMSGTPQNVNLDFLGIASGTTLLNIGKASGSKDLYLVAQTSGAGGQITGLGLATTPGSAKTDFGIVDSSNNVTMVANLLPTTSSLSDNGSSYTLQTYRSNPSYSSVLKIFQSLSYLSGPVLGTDHREPGHGADGIGFGTVEPAMINNNGDGSSVATNVTWHSWGGPKAIGTGISDYYSGATTATDGVSAQATIVAFNLETCEGLPSYNAVTWYFPQYGETFNPNHYWNTCTGEDV